MTILLLHVLDGDEMMFMMSANASYGTSGAATVNRTPFNTDHSMFPYVVCCLW